MAKVKRSEIVRVLELAVEDTGGPGAWIHRWVGDGTMMRKDGLWELRELLVQMRSGKDPVHG